MISLIVATKDRPADMQKLLQSLTSQSSGPDEIIVVDASSAPVEEVIRAFPHLPVKYIRHWPPSASAQRNAGIQACNPAHSLIGFVDDDTTFEPGAFEAMREFWRHADSNLLGAAFNQCNYPDRGKARFKHSWFAESLGLYSPRPGSVSKSGWHTIIPKLQRTQFVEWLPTGAVLFRRDALISIQFDEFFESYSYLEDLDLSYSIGREGRLAVVAEAGYCHFPSAGGRISMYKFGQYEVRNRLYFVEKHKLSRPLCYLGLIVRSTITLGAFASSARRSEFDRLRGNLNGLMRFVLLAEKLS